MAKLIYSGMTSLDGYPEVVRQMKAEAGRDLSVSGPQLADHALQAGLVDELYLIVAPVAVGGGKQLLPAKVRLGLELMDERRFRSGAVYLRYRIKPERAEFAHR